MSLLAAGLLLIAGTSAFGISLDQLRQDPKLTPQRFAAYFANFEFKFHAELQDAATFLATESGDCDDYATLAAEVLAEKGYTTRLVTVRMAGENHVVCYIAETKCYLDYNNRGFLLRTVYSDGSLPDIAHKVAKSFDAKWTSAIEFTLENGFKHLTSILLTDGSMVRASLQAANVSRTLIPIDF